MSIEGDMTTFVCADTDVHAMIADRMYPVFARHDATSPYIVYRRTATERPKTHTGVTGVARATFILTCWSKSYDEAMDLANKVRARLDATGRGATWTATIIRSCFVVGESDSFEPSPELLEKQYYGREITVEIAYVE